jgi:hypothetical protein
VTSKPWRESQYAVVRPETLAPEIKTLGRLRIGELMELSYAPYIEASKTPIVRV